MNLNDDPAVQRWQRGLAIVVMICVGAMILAGTAKLIDVLF